MEQLLAQLNEHNFQIPNLELNGKMIRVNRTGKKSGWFVGFENKSAKGDTYIVANYGDWKTSEKYEYKQDKRNLNKADKSVLDRKLRECKAEFKRERQDLQNDVCRDAQNLWDSGSDNTRVPYLATKQIPELFGCRSQLGANGRQLLVPCRDSQGRLWGVQKVDPDGSKYFLPGQRVQGCFHTVDLSGGADLSSLNDVWICEGFATAVSISQAVGDPVICAFNSNNLVHVAKDLYDINPTANFWICGDDDQWTMVNDELTNPGRIKAQEAAKKCHGSALFPKFSSLESKPTDFNDLHALEGLPTVADQILGQEEPDKMYVMSLGFDSDYFYYTSSENKYIKNLSPTNHTKNNLLALMPMRYWEALYPGQNESAVSWDDAADDLMEKCRKKGAFNVNNVRSTGAWLAPDKRLVLNLGDSLLLDGKKVSFHGDKSRFIYEPGNLTLKNPSLDYLSDPDCQEFLETLNMLRWSHKDCFKFLAGWLMISPICGALQWRPHLWLSGPSGSGKSTIMSEVVWKILENHGVFYMGQTTEAGIRQSLGKKALPVVFDEFETNDEKSGMRVGAVVELFRQASFESNASVVKGSAGGVSTSYLPRFQGLVSSVNVNLQFEADKNRFTVIELMRTEGGPAQNAEDFKKIQKRFGLIDEQWTLGFYSRIFRLYGVFVHNHSLIFDAITKSYNARFAQQYGALLAGYSICFGSEKITEAQAQWFVDDCDLDVKKHEQNDSDESSCYAFLAGKKIRLNGAINSDVAVSHMIEGATNDSFDPIVSGEKREWKKALSLYGMKVDETHLYVANDFPELNALFKGTKWENIYARSLRRIDGADNNSNRAVWIAGTSRKVTKIPLKLLKPNLS